jgi:hypothetical protein
LQRQKDKITIKTNKKMVTRRFVKPTILYVGTANDLERFLEREVRTQEVVTLDSYIYD